MRRGAGRRGRVGGNETAPMNKAFLAETLGWPFFDDAHRRFAAELVRWADATLPTLDHDDVDAACRARVRALGEAGFLRGVVPAEYGGPHGAPGVRPPCPAAEILA